MSAHEAVRAMEDSCLGRRAAMVVALAAALVVAGCIGATDEADPADEELGTANATSPDDELRVVDLYAFEGPVNGTSPPDPKGQGSLASDEPARTDTFAVPANKTTVSFDVTIYQGSGLARIAIVDEAGEIVYRTKTYAYAGQPCGGTVGVSPGETTEPEQALEPGTYEVRYHVAGTVCVDVEISASVPR
jgi:hypothetical protein